MMGLITRYTKMKGLKTDLVCYNSSLCWVLTFLMILMNMWVKYCSTLYPSLQPTLKLVSKIALMMTEIISFDYFQKLL